MIEENHQLQEVLGVDYFTTLAQDGALMVQSFGIGHPSELNYLALFSGSSQGATGDPCPPSGSPFSSNNLAAQLTSAGLTFTGYAESQPSNPISPCTASPWLGYHAPWLFFSNVPSSSAQPLTSFPSNFSALPTVSFVVPNATNDAHDGTVQQASDWLRTHIEPYRQWAMTNNSLLIVTFDEDDDNGTNLVYTVFVGPMVKPGIYNETINHYNVLSTIEDRYGLNHLATANGITDIFE